MSVMIETLSPANLNERSRPGAVVELQSLPFFQLFTDCLATASVSLGYQVLSRDPVCDEPLPM